MRWVFHITVHARDVYGTVPYNIIHSDIQYRIHVQYRIHTQYCIHHMLYVVQYNAIHNQHVTCGTADATPEVHIWPLLPPFTPTPTRAGAGQPRYHKGWCSPLSLPWSRVREDVKEDSRVAGFGGFGSHTLSLAVAASPGCSMMKVFMHPLPLTMMLQGCQPLDREVRSISSAVASEI